MVSSKESKIDDKKIVATICRLTPIHYGHKKYLINLTKDFEKVIVMIGSCYEGGSLKHCITATEREKMLRAVFKRENIPEEKFEIIPIPDLNNFEKWFDMVLEICRKYNVNYLCTGNKEDIIDVLKERGEPLPFEIINPEENSDFPYHATDIRKLIIEGKYEELEKLIPDETKPILFRYTFKEILAASTNRGIKFIKGKQIVNLVFLLRDVTSGKVYVLFGKNQSDKFFYLPGGEIQKYETVTNAVIRKLYEQTGIKIKMLDNSLEPAIIRIENVSENSLEQMSMVGLYSDKENLQEGFAQAFGVFIEASILEYSNLLKLGNDFCDVRFYDINNEVLNNLKSYQKQMLSKALTMFEAYPKLIKEVSSEE